MRLRTLLRIYYLGTDPDHLGYPVGLLPDFLGTPIPVQPDPVNGAISHSPTFNMSTSVKSLRSVSVQGSTPPQRPYLCANHAPVTIDSFSRTCPKDCGPSAMTTTAFCTVLLVTSAGRFKSSFESTCRVQDIPKTDVAGVLEFVLRRRVK